jgi:hypothetical protein
MRTFNVVFLRVLYILRSAALLSREEKTHLYRPNASFLPESQKAGSLSTSGFTTSVLALVIQRNICIFLVTALLVPPDFIAVFFRYLA